MYLPEILIIERNIDNTGFWVWVAANDGIRIIEPFPHFVSDREDS